MPDQHSSGWEPERSKMGNWREMFEQSGGPAGGAHATPPARVRSEPEIDAAEPELDDREYRPWTLQRVRGRPPMFLHLRRYDKRSGMWQGWVLPYPGLRAVEYVGDRMLSFDFGTRLFVIEGEGLDRLAQAIQEGTVITINEYVAELWPMVGAMVIHSIRELGQKDVR